MNIVHLLVSTLVTFNSIFHNPALHVSVALS